MSSGPQKFSIARRVGREKFSCKKSFEPDPPPVINNDWSLSSSQNWTGLVSREPKKTQMKNTSVMMQQTATGLKVLKNWYRRSGPNPLSAWFAWRSSTNFKWEFNRVQLFHPLHKWNQPCHQVALSNINILLPSTATCSKSNVQIFERRSGWSSKMYQQGLFLAILAPSMSNNP